MEARQMWQTKIWRLISKRNRIRQQTCSSYNSQPGQVKDATKTSYLQKAWLLVFLFIYHLSDLYSFTKVIKD